MDILTRDSYNALVFKINNYLECSPENGIQIDEC